MKVAIIGTGNIGTDLLIKLTQCNEFEVVGFVGRRPSARPLPLNTKYFENGIQFFIEHPKCCEIVFDCTDASSAVTNAHVFSEQEIFVIDLTPSKLGKLCVPPVCHSIFTITNNVNMITCGGQVSIPLVRYLANRCDISYVEIVTQISSISAGLATRMNVDKYIETTENAVVDITGVPKCKVILNVNPCEETMMCTTVFAKTSKEAFEDFDEFISSMRKYIPNYLPSHPVYKNGILMVSVKIEGSAHYLSKYAGNLDVINCAAVQVAKQFKEFKHSKS